MTYYLYESQEDFKNATLEAMSPIERAEVDIYKAQLNLVIALCEVQNDK